MGHSTTEAHGRDATKLDGFENRFDTVVDSAFFHTFGSDEALQLSYLEALHRATRPGARLLMLEFGPQDVNGFSMLRSIPEAIFRRLLPAAGWNITYLGQTTYQANVSVESFEMLASRDPDVAEQLKPMLERLRIIEPWLVAAGRTRGSGRYTPPVSISHPPVPDPARPPPIPPPAEDTPTR